jgi:3-hydroxymyristoyl/3-hydroxydecanoyl-(acyl carrier protein) dehydratase
MSLEKSWYIDAQQPVFAGHFPGNPIMPGVLVLGFLKSLLAEHLVKPVQIAYIKRQKFMRPVLPGNTLKISINTLQIDGEFIDVNYMAVIAEGPVAKGSISFKFTMHNGKE